MWWSISNLLSFRGARQREPGIHTPDRGYGFRACVLRTHPGMTTERFARDPSLRHR
jgi:hypothetical protein